MNFGLFSSAEAQLRNPESMSLCLSADAWSLIRMKKLGLSRLGGEDFELSGIACGTKSSETKPNEEIPPHAEDESSPRFFSGQKALKKNLFHFITHLHAMFEWKLLIKYFLL